MDIQFIDNAKGTGHLLYAAESDIPVPETRIDQEATHTSVGGVYTTRVLAEQACNDDYQARRKEWREVPGIGEDGIDEQLDGLVYTVKTVIVNAAFRR